MPALCGVQLSIVKGIGEELVDEGAEGHAAAPAGGEVLDVHVLQASGGPRGLGEPQLEGLTLPPSTLPPRLAPGLCITQILPAQPPWGRVPAAPRGPVLCTS